MKQAKFFNITALAKSPYYTNEPCYRTALSLIFFNYYLFEPSSSQVELELHELFEAIKQESDYKLSAYDQKFFDLNHAYIYEKSRYYLVDYTSLIPILSMNEEPTSQFNGQWNAPRSHALYKSVENLVYEEVNLINLFKKYEYVKLLTDEDQDKALLEFQKELHKFIYSTRKLN